MPEEIKAGDWVSWPGVLGRDQGKVMSVDGDTYSVQIKPGVAPSYTTISRDQSVKKIAPPEDWEAARKAN